MPSAARDGCSREKRPIEADGSERPPQPISLPERQCGGRSGRQSYTCMVTPSPSPLQGPARAREGRGGGVLGTDVDIEDGGDLAAPVDSR